MRSNKSLASRQSKPRSQPNRGLVPQKVNSNMHHWKDLIFCIPGELSPEEEELSKSIGYSNYETLTHEGSKGPHSQLCLMYKLGKLPANIEVYARVPVQPADVAFDLLEPVIKEYLDAINELAQECIDDLNTEAPASN